MEREFWYNAATMELKWADDTVLSLNPELEIDLPFCGELSLESLHDIPDMLNAFVELARFAVAIRDRQIGSTFPREEAYRVIANMRQNARDLIHKAAGKDI